MLDELEPDIELDSDPEIGPEATSVAELEAETVTLVVVKMVEVSTVVEVEVLEPEPVVPPTSPPLLLEPVGVEGVELPEAPGADDEPPLEPPDFVDEDPGLLE